jgi:signal transduction histidine kinase
MSAPIMDGDRVAGVVRCSIGRGPMYFGERQLAMLEQTSARVGSALSAVVRNRSLEALVENVKELNQFAHEELMKAAPDENRILEAALAITRRLLPDAERIDVRLLSDDDASLRHSAPDEAIGGDERRRPVEPISNESSDQTIIAPLTLGAEVFGVLDVHAATGHHFHDFDVQTTGLLASQLAMYRRLAITIRHLKKLVRELNMLRDQQVQIHEDLSHQLKSPTITAYRRVDSIVRRMPDSPLKAELLKVRGVCARAMHVTATAGVFAHLARDKAIPVTRTAMSGEELLRLVINTAQDASYIVRGDQKHSFEVRSEGFAAIGAINVDRGLLEQALTQLLDNAFKYSFPKSVVTITAGITRSDRAARISISNEGIPLRPTEVARCVERGWQSEDARDVSDTGSGIGLWVVDRTMQAQGGALEIAPTDRTGRTTFSLLLPL